VLVTADHGEAFGEHGRFGHHPYPYEELVRVPLVVAGPGVESTMVNQQVSLLDLAPTILAAVGADIPEKMEGDSFVPALRGEAIDDRAAMTISDNGTLYSCRTSDWKYITRWNGDESSLYDLQDDPDEVTDIKNDHPDIIERFGGIVSHYREEVDTDDEANINQPPEVQQRLEDLGYVND
jgi:arylsulfatase A-like enzyme